jgi:hypothetical protein
LALEIPTLEADEPAAATGVGAGRHSEREGVLNFEQVLFA